VPTPDTAPTLTRGHKKKARTRQLLLDTALEVLGEQGESFSVADLAARAGVSHGTFYNYFTDREALVEALVPHIVGRFSERMAVEVTDTDPAVRFARITANGFDMAIREPRTVRVALRIDAVRHGLLADGPHGQYGDELASGYAAGRFTGTLDDGTLDVLLGALLFAARRIVDGEHSVEYRRTVLGRVLQSLGVDASEAAAIAAHVVQRGD
jgi:AcrR family transcriptional regulator